MISHPWRKCSSVVSRLPRPILITVRPHNFVCVRYARPDALIRSTMSLFNWSMLSVVAGVGDPGPASTMPATAPINRKQTTPMPGCADNSKRSSFLIQSASKLDAVVHIVFLRVDRVTTQIFWHKAEHAPQSFEVAHIKHAEIERHKDCFVRIDYYRICQLPAFSHPFVLRHHREPTTISGVDVQPDFCFAAKAADLANGIDACSRCRPHRGDDRHRLKTIPPIFCDSLA